MISTNITKRTTTTSENLYVIVDAEERRLDQGKTIQKAKGQQRTGQMKLRRKGKKKETGRQAGQGKGIKEYKSAATGKPRKLREDIFWRSRVPDGIEATYQQTQESAGVGGGAALTAHSLSLSLR